MLSIGKLSLGQEAYYLEEVLDGAEDYYLSVGEAPGRWVGTGAARLGLEDQVDGEQLRAVLAGRRPGTDEPLRRTRASRPGLALTLSAPKSVSVVWGLGDKATAEAVVACHDRAVDAALEYLERHACHVRRGHAGAVVHAGRGFVGAAFRHRTSRAGDPALHTHVLLANLAEGPAVDPGRPHSVEVFGAVVIVSLDPESDGSETLSMAFDFTTFEARDRFPVDVIGFVPGYESIR